jgi:DNA-formamidopyrimidine glycosylase
MPFITGSHSFSKILYLTDIPHPYNNIGDGPEGPEARVSANVLERKLLCKYITGVSVDERSKINGVSLLTGGKSAKIIKVRSYGKKIIIELDTNIVIITSLGMTGRWQYSKGNHSHTMLKIEDLQSINNEFIRSNVCDLYFDDVRYMGKIDIIKFDNLNGYLGTLGPDLLQCALKQETWIKDGEWLKIFKADRLKNRSVCQVLLDQDVIAGIGNYLKSEILYLSRVHPDRRLKDITDEEWDRIRMNSHKVIKLAYDHGGFTIESFLSPDGELGNYSAMVYGKTQDPYGNKVTRIVSRDNRTSHIVEVLQK